MYSKIARKNGLLVITIILLLAIMMCGCSKFVSAPENYNIESIASTTESFEKNYVEDYFKLYNISDKWEFVGAAPENIQIFDVLYTPNQTVYEIVDLILSSELPLRIVDDTGEFDLFKTMSKDAHMYFHVSCYGTELFKFLAWSDNENEYVSNMMVSSIIAQKEIYPYCYFFDGSSYRELTLMSKEEFESHWGRGINGWSADWSSLGGGSASWYGIYDDLEIHIEALFGEDSTDFIIRGLEGESFTRKK